MQNDNSIKNWHCFTSKAKQRTKKSRECLIS